MKKIFITASMLATLMFSISSCSKKDSTTQNTPSSSSPTVTAPTNADGAFAAVKAITNVTVQGYPVSTTIGTAVTWFGTQTTYVDGGTVKCNTNTLTKQTSNNAYVYTPGTTNPTGIDFSGSVAWDISGNTATGVPAFTKTDGGSFPDITDINNTTDVSTSAAYTLSASGSVTGSDSVIFVVAGPNAHILKTKGPNTSSCDFTASEMASLGTGSNVGILQIAPYKITFDNASGKNYYFIKEAVVSKTVNLK